jgi:hypothetical protein
MKISFAYHEFLLHPAGILFWPEKSMAIVSDLHLEKGSHFAQKGFFLPPYDTQETLERLHKTIADLKPRKILILGDTFHDAKGHARLPSQERALFDKLLGYNPIWITGNHDGDFVPQGFTAHQTFTLEGITFNHEATLDAAFEISGHFHPKVDIVHKRAFISRPCFIEDGNKMILPAFGAYTGGLPITHGSFTRILKNPRIYALGNKVYALGANEKAPL